MIAIGSKNSNVTIYRIPINGNETRRFALPYPSNPRAFQILMDFFNSKTTTTTATTTTTTATTTNKTITLIATATSSSTMTQTTNHPYHTQNIIFIIGSLIILFLFLLLFTIFLVVYIKRHRYCRHKQHYQSSLCVIDNDKKTNNHDIPFNRIDDDDDDDDSKEEKGMVYHLNHDQNLNNQHYQPTICKMNDDNETNNHDTYLFDDDDSEKRIPMVYNLNHDQKMDSTNASSILTWISSRSYIPEQFL